MDTPTASVVIPCHNCAATVERAVRSALAQSRPPIEVICVDDGSTDGTLEVLGRLAAEAPGRIRMIVQPNAGACAARNRGLAHVTASYVQFLDADDWIHPSKLSHQLGLVASKAAHSARGSAPGDPASGDLASGGPDIIAGSYTRLRLDGREVVRIAWPRDVWAALAWVRLGITSANLFRRAAVEAVGGWNEAWASSQEYELMFRLLCNGARVLFDQETLTGLYQQPASITQSAPEANLLRRIELGAAIRAHVRGMGDDRALCQTEAALFALVQMRCAFDVQRGVASYREHFGPGYVPPPASGAGWAYRQLHRTLGFGLAQRVRAAVRTPDRPPSSRDTTRSIPSIPR